MPNFPFKTLSGVPWPNADTPNKRFSMLVFYRGIQCSYCEKYIKTNFAEGSKYPSNFVRLYAKILLERKEFEKAITFLSGEARSSF